MDGRLDVASNRLAALLEKMMMMATDTNHV